jgi:hypothetical protein
MRTKILAFSTALAALVACGSVAPVPSGTEAEGGTPATGDGSAPGATPPGPATSCTPRSPPRDGERYPHEALPSGACTNEPTCTLAIVDCPCGDYPLDEYTCTCVNGAWSCNMTAQGASVCTCSDGGMGQPEPPACSYPPANNDPGCPATYSFSLYQQPCPAIGLACAYPGRGDEMPDGCFATAMAWCKGDGGAGTPGTWTVAQ